MLQVQQQRFRLALLFCLFDQEMRRTRLISGLDPSQEPTILIAGGQSASALGSKPATTTSLRSPSSQPIQPHRHRLGDRHQEGQIEAVDRVAGEVVMGIAQEGGVGD